MRTSEPLPAGDGMDGGRRRLPERVFRQDHGAESAFGSAQTGQHASGWNG